MSEIVMKLLETKTNFHFTFTTGFCSLLVRLVFGVFLARLIFFQWKTMLVEKTVIEELVESQTVRLYSLKTITELKRV